MNFYLSNEILTNNLFSILNLVESVKFSWLNTNPKSPATYLPKYDDPSLL